jgi:hypothetical protein
VCLRVLATMSSVKRPGFRRSEFFDGLLTLGLHPRSSLVFPAVPAMIRLETKPLLTKATAWSEVLPCGLWLLRGSFHGGESLP